MVAVGSLRHRKDLFIGPNYSGPGTSFIQVRSNFIRVNLFFIMAVPEAGASADATASRSSGTVLRIDSHNFSWDSEANCRNDWHRFPKIPMRIHTDHARPNLTLSSTVPVSLYLLYQAMLLLTSRTLNSWSVSLQLLPGWWSLMVPFSLSILWSCCD